MGHSYTFSNKELELRTKSITPRGQEIINGINRDRPSTRGYSDIYSDSVPLNNDGSGIYILFDKGEIVYVGQSKRRLLKRITDHLGGISKKKFDRYTFIPLPSNELDNTEAEYILKFKPKYNKRLPTNDFWISDNTLHIHSGLYSKSGLKDLLKRRLTKRDGYYSVKDVGNLIRAYYSQRQSTDKE